MLTLPQKNSEPMFDCLGPCLIAWGHPWESVLALVNMSTIRKSCSDSCSLITCTLDKELLFCTLGTTGNQEVTAQQDDLLLLSVLLA